MTTATTYTVTNLVGGEQAVGASDDVIEVLNPSNEEVLSEFRASSDEQVDAAVAVAKRASSDWSRLTPAARSEILREVADLLAQHSDELGLLESIDAGKPITTAQTIEMPGVIAGMRYFAGAGRSSTALSAGEYLADNTIMVRREPVGVVAAITPWNFPLLQAVWKIGPALATGNTVVIKPAENTPLSTARFVELANEVIPPGVLNIVHGRGPTVGERLVAHRDVALVSFTGSTRAGQRVAQLAAAGPKRVVLELGGNAPVVVFDDADLEKLVPMLATAVLFNAGQECMSGNRILVAEGLYEPLVTALTEAMSEWRIGDTSDPSTTLGPLISSAQLQSVQRVVDARPDHAQVLLGGEAPDGPGFFFSPTLIGGLRQSDELVQTEVFGPVATVQTFTNEAEAVAMANDTPYGLAASVWTRDLARGMRLGRDLDFGSVWINNHFALGPEVPQGGFGASGYGKEGGLPGLDELTRLKQVSVSLA